MKQWDGEDPHRDKRGDGPAYVPDPVTGIAPMFAAYLKHTAPRFPERVRANILDAERHKVITPAAAKKLLAQLGKGAK